LGFPAGWVEERNQTNSKCWVSFLNPTYSKIIILNTINEIQSSSIGIFFSFANADEGDFHTLHENPPDFTCQFLFQPHDFFLMTEHCFCHRKKAFHSLLKVCKKTNAAVFLSAKF